MANIHTFSSINKNNNNNNRASSGQGRYATLSNSSPSSQDTSSDSNMFSINMPDENGNAQKVNILHVLFPGFKVKSFVFYLSMFQIALFLVTRIWGWAIPDPFASNLPKHNDPLDKTPLVEQDDQAFNCVLYKFGAKFTPAILGLYQIQRLLLPVFLHAGFGHVFFNMLSQWFYGFHLEQLYSTKKFIILYFASAVGGNLLSGIQNTDNISVGASSALFGIFAFQVAYLFDNYENLGPRKNVQIFVIALMLFANVGSATSETAKIDNSAHLGGFLAGGLIAIYYMGSNAESKFKNYHRRLILLLIAYFLITSIWLASTTIKDAAKIASDFSQKCKESFKLW